MRITFLVLSLAISTISFSQLSAIKKGDIPNYLYGDNNFAVIYEFHPISGGQNYYENKKKEKFSEELIDNQLTSASKYFKEFLTEDLKKLNLTPKFITENIFYSNVNSNKIEAYNKYFKRLYDNKVQYIIKFHTLIPLRSTILKDKVTRKTFTNSSISIYKYDGRILTEEQAVFSMECLRTQKTYEKLISKFQKEIQSKGPDKLNTSLTNTYFNKPYKEYNEVYSIPEDVKARSLAVPLISYRPSQKGRAKDMNSYKEIMKEYPYPYHLVDYDVDMLKNQQLFLAQRFWFKYEKYTGSYTNREGGVVFYESWTRSKELYYVIYDLENNTVIYPCSLDVIRKEDAETIIDFVRLVNKH